MREVIDYMELKKVPPGSYVIREGDSGKRESKDVVVGQVPFTYDIHKSLESKPMINFRVSPLRVGRG